MFATTGHYRDACQAMAVCHFELEKSFFTSGKLLLYQELDDSVIEFRCIPKLDSKDFFILAFGSLSLSSKHVLERYKRPVVVGMVMAPWDMVQRLRNGSLEKVFQDGVEEDRVGIAGMLFDLLHAE
jgi:hypothetical protein